jgi:hypothetical protein
MSKPKGGRRSRRYVHRDEKSFKKERPKDGEKILFRQSGHKSYLRGTWDEDAEAVTCGDEKAPSRIDLRFLMGWLPAWYGDSFP